MKCSTRSVTPKQVLRKLRGTFRRTLGVGRKRAAQLLANGMLYDKAYEVSCMLEMISRMRAGTTLDFRLSSGSTLVFRAKGGPIVRGTWPHVEVRDHPCGSVIAEIWVDIEIRSMSAWQQGIRITGRPYGRAHELDAVVVEASIAGYPDPDSIFLGMEAKHRAFNKALLKELLGVRREMCFAQPGCSYFNPFAWWSSTRSVPADPPSGLVAFCSSATIGRYSHPADYWGVEMIHHAA